MYVVLCPLLLQAAPLYSCSAAYCCCCIGLPSCCCRSGLPLAALLLLLQILGRTIVCSSILYSRLKLMTTPMALAI